MYRNRSADVHSFAMIPRAEIPRSSFRMQKTLKTAFDSGRLVPMFCEEVLPGDTFSVNGTFFTRLATPIFPFMDNLYMDTFFFFVPNRLVWGNWKKFMGEQDAPSSSTDYIVPRTNSPTGGWSIGSIADYFGLPTQGQVGGASVASHSSLPLRAYNLIYNEWFRDENLVNPQLVPFNDGPDVVPQWNLPPLKRGKRKDYFTSALPWPQKGDSVMLPLGTTAPIIGLGVDGSLGTLPSPQSGIRESTGTTRNYPFAVRYSSFTPANNIQSGWMEVSDGTVNAYPQVFADLSDATAATINQIRQAFQIQKLLERDARGGTRYTEIVRAHFGVVSPDARLQRPEYLGGGSTAIIVNPVAQTSNTGADTTPQGNLSGFATGLGRHGFSQSFTEHGYIIGIVSVRADLTYQQGLRRHWSRITRYDYYFPAFAMLGEQAILNQEIYYRGVASDEEVFGYQERWAEYRYSPSEVTGLMRSTATNTIDAWHLAQRFTSLPALNESFIEESPPLSRVLAVGEEAAGQELLMDAFFDIKAARPLPMYSVPGLIDHF